MTDSRFVCSQHRRAVGHCPLLIAIAHCPLPIAHCPLPIALLCHVQQPNSSAKSAALYALRPRDSIGRGQGQRTTRWVFRPPPSIQSVLLHPAIILPRQVGWQNSSISEGGRPARSDRGSWPPWTMDHGGPIDESRCLTEYLKEQRRPSNGCKSRFRLHDCRHSTLDRARHSSLESHPSISSASLLRQQIAGLCSSRPALLSLQYGTY
jgi:hypothetical protein